MRPLVSRVGGFEIRGVTCPQCNPALDKPDHIRGYRDSLKYLIFQQFKCRNCGTTVVDIGEIAANDSGHAKV